MKLLFIFLLCVFSNVYAASDRLAPVIDNSINSNGSAKRSGKISNNSMYEILGRLEQMQSELQQLRGLVEEQSQLLNQLDIKQNNMYSDLDNRLQELSVGTRKRIQGIEGGLENTQNLNKPINVVEKKPAESIISQVSGKSEGKVVVPIPAVAPTTPVATPTPPPVGIVDKVEMISTEKPTNTVIDKPVVNTNKSIVTTVDNSIVSDNKNVGSQKKMYQSAYEKLRNGHNTEAIEGFKRLLISYPDGELAGSSQYWLGEAYKLTNDLAAAKQAYSKVVSRYGRGSRVPDALLKLGFIELEKHNKVNARDYLSQITTRYPDSTAAHLARKKLLQMETK
ncbi:MAG: tol-pal system protein YbgF [Methylococcales bacterium]|nr:tol-pal system protein YbgF [Methylococcales bacterium]